MQTALFIEETLSEPTFNPRSTLAEFLEEAIRDQTRLTATYEKRVFVAVVHSRDKELIATLKTYLEQTQTHEISSTSEEVSKEVTHIEILNGKTSRLATLRGLLNFAAVHQERMLLTFQKLVIVVIPLLEEKLIEEIEDCIDNADADDALKEDGYISLDDLIKELGL
jgi:hypothetical protein